MATIDLSWFDETIGGGILTANWVSGKYAALASNAATGRVLSAANITSLRMLCSGGTGFDGGVAKVTYNM